MNKFTACPFCGGELEHYARKETGYSVIGIRCSLGCDCQVEQEGDTPESAEKVMAAWSKRPISDALWVELDKWKSWAEHVKNYMGKTEFDKMQTETS